VLTTCTKYSFSSRKKFEVKFVVDLSRGRGLIIDHTITTLLRAVINRVNLGLDVNKKDEVLVDLIKYNRVDGISWLNQVPVECPKVVPPVECL
jgi:hypothetical protein